MEVTLALAILLVGGFAAAQLARALRVPSVTGYLVVGVLLGPSVANVVSEETLSPGLSHFTDIALMLIAFTIGEKLDLREIGRIAKRVGWIAMCEALGAFVLVSGVSLAVALALQVGPGDWDFAHYLALSIILGSIAIATAPAATVLVFRELRSSGPLTRALMAVVACDDGMAIMGFGIATSAARVLSGSAGGNQGSALVLAAVEIMSSLLLGAVTGLLLDTVARRIRVPSDLLIAGLGLVLLCGEVARVLHVSPLLAGMAAGFAVVNRGRRDVRVFRVINSFEAPIYVLFFTLAGAHLHLGSVLAGGVLTVVYVLARFGGKALGAYIGARIAHAPATVQRYLGLALLPQAGVAIGLAFAIRDDQVLTAYAGIVLPVVLASVVVNELVGPPAARLAAIRAGEAEQASVLPDARTPGLPRLEIVPWTWPRLDPPPRPEGHVVMPVSHPDTAAGVTRIATLLSHHFGALPLAVHVVPESEANELVEGERDREVVELFRMAHNEALRLGYDIETEVEFAADVAEGILRVAETQDARAVVLGHPLARQAPLFGRIVDAVAREARWPVVVVRFIGPLHTERILVPITTPEELGVVQPLVCALSMVSEHQVTFLRLMAPEAGEAELAESERELSESSLCHDVPARVEFRSVAAESWVETIVEAAGDHDVIVMAAATQTGLRRVFFGSLAEEVAQRSPRPMLLVRGGMESEGLRDMS